MASSSRIQLVARVRNRGHALETRIARIASAGRRVKRLRPISSARSRRDTVEPVDVAHATGTGIVAAASDASSLLLACEDALGLWRESIGFESLVARAMARDSSWDDSARKYLSMYEALRGQLRP